MRNRIDVAADGDHAIVGSSSRAFTDSVECQAIAFTQQDGDWSRQALSTSRADLGACFGMSVDIHESAAVVVGQGTADTLSYAEFFTLRDEWTSNTAWIAPAGYVVTDAAVGAELSAVAASPWPDTWADPASRPPSILVFLQQKKGSWKVRKTLRVEGRSSVFGFQLALQDEFLVVSDESKREVLTFERRSGGWSQADTLAGPPSANSFGISLALAGNHLAVGADGSMHIYERTASGWKLESSTKGQGDSICLGASVAALGDEWLVGSPCEFGVGPLRGRSFTLADETLTPLATGDGPYDQFGAGVAVGSNHVLIASTTRVITRPRPKAP